MTCFTSYQLHNAFTGSFAPSKRQEGGRGIYYSYRKNQGFDNLAQYGAASLLAILKRLTESRQGVRLR
ncbi:MAG: hypothetical protein HS126_22040 [Anaerolineales bacterium]|nr:hypothetical protein [Anaerolineales bacterium]